ncbi:MAG: PAS domain S-box protein [Thermodesulfobacteriota bacterium]
MKDENKTKKELIAELAELRRGLDGPGRPGTTEASLKLGTQQATISELGQFALSGADLSVLFDMAVNLTAKTLSVEYSKVLGLLPDRKSLLLRAGVGWKEGLVGKTTVGSERESQAGYTLMSSEPVVVKDLRKETRFNGPPLLTDHKVVGGMSVIIGEKNDPFGVLGVHTGSERAFTVDDINFLQAAANILAAAIGRKRVEDALREKEDFFRRLVESTNIVVWEMDVATRRFTYVGPQALDITGYRPEEWVDLDAWSAIVHPDDREWTVDFCLTSTAEGKDHDFEYRMVTKDGRTIWVKDIVSVVFGDDGPVTLRGFIFDITELKAVEEALESSRKMLHAVMDTIPVRVFWKDRDLKYLGCNLSFARDAGLDSPKEIIGKDDFQMSWRSEAELYRADDRAVIETGEARLNYEEPQTWPDGTEMLLRTSKVPLRDRDGNIFGVLGTYEDITELKAAEKEALRAQKLESLGVLAGGIAHDFNNLLVGILGNINLAKHRLEPEDRIYKRIVEAEKASLYATELTQQLLTFSKGGEPVKETILIGDLVEESVRFALRGSNVNYDCTASEGLSSIEADKGQISQAMNNLVINANQAMPGGGTIKVRTENVTVDTKDNLPLKEGKYVKISIEDGGAGISTEDLPRIFDPYFTTKPKGSGLGLASVYSIVNRHEGYIGVASEVGGGTTFRVYLPVSTKKPVEAGEVKETIVAGAGRVLVMDDDAIVREVAKEYLNHIGYESGLAADGAEAVELYRKARESGNPFAAVIMDLTVKDGVGGEEAVKELIKIDPDVKAIVSSGYSGDTIMANYNDYGFRGVIAKPYTLPKLSEVLDKVLR